MDFEKKILRENNFLYENYNLRKVCYLYENINDFIPKCYTKCNTKEDLEKEKHKCIKFLEEIIMNDGKIKVNYGYSKSKNYGRLYANNFSLQMIACIIRNYLLENEGISDTDIVNCACSLLLGICDKYNIECPILKNYVLNRQEIINNNYQGDKDKCKSFINVCLYSSKEQIKYYHNDFEIKFKEEINYIQDFFYNYNEDDTINKIKEDIIKNNDENIKGKLLNGIINNLECKVLLRAVDYYKKNTNKSIFTLFFDGFLSYKTNDINILNKLNNYIQEIYSVEGKYIKFIHKPIENDKNIIDIPNNYNFDLDKIKIIIQDKKYNYINNTIKLNDITDDNYVNLLMKLMKNNFVFINKSIYVYYNDKWYQDEDICKYTIKNTIINYLEYRLTKSNYKFCNLNENQQDIIKEIDMIQNFTSKIKSSSKINNVYKLLLIELSPTNNNNIKFDTLLPNVFCFNNIAFNITTGNIIKVKKEDYITLNTGYDFIEPTQDQYELIHNTICAIFPDEEYRKSYLSILFSGLSAIRPENFFMANGCGRNGKGVINELMLETTGNYGFKGNVSILTDKIKTGGNTEVSNLNKKRFVIFNEPNDDETIKGGNIKRLTGDEKIDARQLYSQGTEQTKLYMTIVFECNKKPNIVGRIDESMIERFVDIYFESYFTNDTEQLQNNPKAKKQNPYLKQDDFKFKHKCALFLYLLENAPKKIYIPDKIKIRTREYLLDNDELYNWFLDNYQRSIHDFVKIKDVYYNWKHSDLYQNLSKKEKRKNNEKYFKRVIDENVELRKYHIDIHNYYNEKNERKKVRSILLNWKLKENEDNYLLETDED